MVEVGVMHITQSRPLLHHPSACTLNHALPAKGVINYLFLVADF